MPGRDSYWDQTSLLINGNDAVGSGGWDAGPNKLAVTTVGNPQRDAASPFQSAPGYWSNSFDGSGDYLTTPSNTALTLGTSDFTIEFWVNFNNVSTSSILYDQRSAAGQVVPTIFYDSTGTNGICFYVNSVSVITSGITLSTSTWYHVAVSRASGSTKLFINGTQYGSTYTDANNYLGNPVGIGAYLPSLGANSANCYISNLRVVKGTAVYTTTFVPPTTALTAITNTSLLTCQDNRFKDNSTNNFTLTAAGNVSVEPESPFRGGSLYFDGSGGTALSFNPSSAVSFGTGDFTIEAFVNINPSASISYIIDARNSSQTSSWYFLITPDKKVAFYYPFGVKYESSGVIAGNIWNHIAVVRNSGTLTIYINGVSQLSTPMVDDISSSQTTSYIGSAYNSSSNFYGYISNLRIVKGTALYTANFTPPGNELTPIANTSLLTCQSPTQLVDYSTNNFTITASGNATVSNAGPGLLSRKNSVYFDGNGDYLTTPSTGQFSATGDFTVSLWYYPPTGALSGYNALIGVAAAPATASDWVIEVAPTGILKYWDNVGARIQTSATAVVENQWNYIVLARSGTTITMYVNGTSVGTYTSSVTFGDAAKALKIGGGFASGVTRGYLSNVRLVSGSAITTVPTQPLEAVTGTILLVCQSETFDDTSSNNFTIAVNGTPFTSQFNPYDTSRSTYGSVYVGNAPGSAAYLLTQASTALTVGTGDFTLEGWFNPTADAAGIPILRLNGTKNSLILQCNSKVFRVLVNTTAVISGTSLFVQNNAWYHLAVVRSGGSMILYVNGVQQGSTYTSTENFDTTTHSVSYSNNVPGGLVSNARLSVGTARYTSNFTPSLTHFQADGQTTALLAGTSDVTPRNKLFIDGSSNKFAITANGNVTQGTFSPYTTRNGQDYSSSVNGGSAYFDGTGDYLTCNPGSTTAFGTGDFTVETWVNISSLSSNRYIVDTRGSGGQWAFIARSTGAIYWYNGSADTFSTSTMPTGVWNHIVYCRSGTTYYMFLNGVLVGTGTDSTNYSASSALTHIGSKSTLSEQFAGYISDLRVIKGKALYTANFSVPTQPLGLYSVGGGTTSLYLPFTAGSIIDQTGKNAIEPVGDVKQSTLIEKYSNSAIHFDGNGDYLKLSNNSVCQFGTGDYTVECWFNLNTTNISYPRIIALGATNTAGNFQIELNPTAIRIHNNTTYSALTYAWVAGVWYHLAVVRKSGTLTVYVNGTSIYTDATNYTSSVNSTGTLTIGSSDNGNWFNGYIDDLRITKGVARYTANFTVPSTNLPTAGIYTQPVVTNYKDQGTDLGSKYVTRSYVMDYYQDLIPSMINGVIWGVGNNSNAQLGDGTLVSKSSPVTVLGKSGGWKSVSIGGFYPTTFAIDQDNNLWCWGYGSSSGLSGNISSPVMLSVYGQQANWKQTSSGGWASASRHYGIKTDGTLWGWGQTSTYSGVGTVSTSPKSILGGGTNWKQVDTFYQHTAAIKTDGTLWSWGDNAYGMVGDGTTSTRSSPVTTAGGGTNWKQVACGYRHTVAVKTDGTLWTWGYNTNGQLGTGNSSAYSSPITTIVGGNDWKQVACAHSSTLAIKQDGTLWAWGQNNSGMLGDGTTTERSSPVSVAGAGTNWKTVFAGLDVSAAIKTDGTLWTWGHGEANMLGVMKYSPTLVPNIKNWKTVSIGKPFTSYKNMIGIADPEV